MIPDELVTVTVTSSSNAIRGDENSPVDNATVEIFAGSSVPLAVLNYVAGTNGVYKASDFRPISGVTYQIRVFAPGYDLAFANSSVPPASNIESVSSTNVERILVDNFATYKFDFGLAFDDPEGVNYYNLHLYQERLHFVLLSNGDTSMTSRTLTPIDFPSSPDNYYRLVDNSGGILFIDDPFSQNMTIPLSSTIDIRTEKIGQVYAELRTVSEEYYLYQESIIGRSISINGGLSPSNNSFSNVYNGGGNVSGYSSRSDSLMLIP